MRSLLGRGCHLLLPEADLVPPPPHYPQCWGGQGVYGDPLVERSVAMQLSLGTTATWQGNPCLPSQACKYSSSLTGNAYRACGEAASTLHAMPLLQVHQAKTLKDLHKRGLQELRSRNGPHATSVKGHCAVSGLCDIHFGDPGMPSLPVPT